MPPRDQRVQRKAFTLMEVVVATAAAAILTAGIGAAVVAASQTMPGRSTTGKANDGPEGSRQSAAVVEAMAAELASATGVTSFASKSITFTTADQNADGTAETITYAWSGTPGDPVTRFSSGGSTVTLIPSARDFALSAVTTTAAQTASAALVAAAETPFLQATPRIAYDDPLTNARSIGQSFTPALPSGATGWTLTRIVVPLKQQGIVDGQLSIQVYAIDAAGLPTGFVRATFTVAESTLSATLASLDCTFLIPITFTPGQGACVLLKHSSGAASACARLARDVPVAAGRALLVSSDGCLTWTATPTQSVAIDIYGTVTVTAGAISTRKVMERIGIRLRPSTASGIVIEGGARLLNRPESPN